MTRSAAVAPAVVPAVDAPLARRGVARDAAGAPHDAVAAGWSAVDVG